LCIWHIGTVTRSPLRFKAWNVKGVNCGALPFAEFRRIEMRWVRLSGANETRLRILLLALAVVASVALPYAVVHESTRLTSGAFVSVLRSAEIKETVYELMYTMREIENNLLAMYMAMPTEKETTRFREGRLQATKLLDKLTDATNDNPEQAKRVNDLQVMLEARSKMLDSALQQIESKNFDSAGATIAQARELFQFRVPANEIVVAENALFAERFSQVKQNERNAHWLADAVLIVQLLLLGVVIFVSERQIKRRLQAETLARRAVERSRTIVRTVREPIAVLDTSLSTIMTNNAFREFYGGEEGEHKSRPLSAIGNGAWADAELEQRLLDVAVRDRELWDYELRQRGVDGIERNVLVNARRMTAPDGSDQERSILVTVTDVTARKRAEQQILQLNHALADKVEQVSEINRELEAFSYSVSHDLRAPLRHIAGFADKLGNHLGPTKDEKVDHYLEVINEATQRMSRLIEDLLFYSRLGRTAIRRQAVDMRTMAEQVRDMLMADAGDRQIEWIIHPLPIAIADEIMMRQVWQNLLGNAIKYSAKREHAVIEVGAINKDGQATVFYVRDNGVGFDMEYASKLFGVFQRLHKASDFPGTGIGLANVRRIIARHGGRVWAESIPNQNTTFYFTLPEMMGDQQNLREER
jgi:PAS domain S-box-containing protein